jgi:PIN domain nuclease of toxin-antitoxin system
VKLLLDTHVWLWSHLQPEKLSARVTRALKSASSDLWLSPISVWEFFLLVEHGRVRLAAGWTPTGWVDAALQNRPMREATLTHAVALEAGAVRLPHADPADRLLVATARAYDLTLVTADERLLGKGWRSLANA